MLSSRRESTLRSSVAGLLWVDRARSLVLLLSLSLTPSPRLVLVDGHRRCQRARRVEVVEVVEVDYESPLSLASALRGVEVVISTLAGPGFAAQPALADADKAEGVKLFVLSEVSRLVLF